MQLHLDLNGSGTLHARLYHQLRAALLDGRLTTGEALPPSRHLARDLGISRQVVVEAYERLTSEGLLESRRGSGTFVAKLAYTPQMHVAPVGVEPGSHWQVPPAWGSLPARTYLFAGGLTDKTRVPWREWRRCLHWAALQQAQSPSVYGDPHGDPVLRTAIAEYLGFSRGISCPVDSLLVTHGAQQGLDLLARVRVGPGDWVAVEEPGYPPARAVFEARGARVIGIPVDEQGIRVDCLPAGIKLVYVTPSHQFPLGMPMSLERRVALLEFARRQDVLIVEDDYDGEFRFAGRPLEALKSLDHQQQVAYLGTFSKVLFPELRLGYLVMPNGLRQALLAAKHLTDGHTVTLTQQALGRFMTEGHFARHLRRMQRCYSERRQQLLTALARFDDRLEILPQMAGLHVTVTFHRPQPDLSQQLAEADVGALPLTALYAGEPDRDGLMLGFGALPTREITPAVEALAGAIR